MNELAAETHALVNLEVLRQNLKLLQAHAGNTTAWPAIKANAYGHGAVAVACALEQDVRGFAVATSFEATELRAAGINTSILLLTPPAAQDIKKLVSQEISFVVSSQEEIENLNKEAVAQDKRTKIHLKINTGLNRLGATPEIGAKMLFNISKMPGLELFGIMTHLIDSEDAKPEHAPHQLKIFNDFLETHKPDAKYFHAANSGGILNPALQALLKNCNLIRPGISLYGYAPGPDLKNILPLRPALTLKTRILFVKSIEAAEVVSYNATWQAKEKTRVATLRLGYADGYPRSASGKAQVLLRGKTSDVLGRICMDQCVIDIGNIADVEVGEEVIVYGDASINATHVAAWANTNTYEILTSIALRVERVYTK